jgi:hypothetical protein
MSSFFGAPGMITVVCFPSRDRAEADTPENAVCCARQLLKDALERQARGKDCKVMFFNEDGEMIAERIHV